MIAIVGSDYYAIRLAIEIRVLKPRERIVLIPFPEETFGLILENIQAYLAGKISSYSLIYVSKRVLQESFRIRVESALNELNLKDKIIVTNNGSIEYDKLIIVARPRIIVKLNEEKYILNKKNDLEEFNKRILKGEEYFIKGTPVFGALMSNALGEKIGKNKVYFVPTYPLPVSKEILYFAVEKDVPESAINIQVEERSPLKGKIKVDNCLKISEEAYAIGECSIIETPSNIMTLKDITAIETELKNVIISIFQNKRIKYVPYFKMITNKGWLFVAHLKNALAGEETSVRMSMEEYPVFRARLKMSRRDFTIVSIEAGGLGEYPQIIERLYTFLLEESPIDEIYQTLMIYKSPFEDPLFQLIHTAYIKLMQK